ncbi:MAG TPA: hypothetical protein PKM72_02645 [Nitrospirales bacterium]|nr:hypothetical protein [Nitrospirales bacterium]
MGQVIVRNLDDSIFRSSPRAYARIDRQIVDPTPAGWPNGGTLLSASGPCLSGASWAAL